MPDPHPQDATLMRFARAVAAAESAAALRLLAASPELARARFFAGATRQEATSHHLESMGTYIYAGDTALHVAGAAHDPGLVQALIRAGADVRARNRMGAEPLHVAATGAPGSPRWNPPAQVETIAQLVAAGADPNAADKRGVAPLHRAVRTRCAAAVEALLAAGADAHRRNGNGTTPLRLAALNTGRGGSGSTAAKAQRALILRLLERHGGGS